MTRFNSQMEALTQCEGCGEKTQLAGFCADCRSPEWPAQERRL